MKSGVFKGPPKKKICLSYKKFNSECFRNALREELETLGDTNGDFKKKFIKNKMIIFTDNVFMSKELRKANYEKSKDKRQI